MPPQHLSVVDLSAVKQKAVEDAKRTQASVAQECADAGKDPPPYILLELIGKGSFGRVYKAGGSVPGQFVAVKIISIEEGDSFNPDSADTFGDILKEVSTLKLLKSGGAKNICHVIDTLLVGQCVWMVTDYCAGGSVSSLMRPTRGLHEKWVIPILREVAEALKWVHQQGIIHRDIKCANVLVTQLGDVQIGDFGVAGIVDTKFDKRSTVTGTLQWMAPELFDSNVSYGTEVDIWAFGSMAYEIVSGLPPNARPMVDISQFGSYLKSHRPRLEGDQYSPGLKDLVASCLIEDPWQRPPIEQVQKHPYIFNTEIEHPTASLSELVKAYKTWEAQGGSRLSLFSAGGAQGLTNDHSSDLDDEWNFDTIRDSEQLAPETTADIRAVYDAYGPIVDTPQASTRPQPRRRRQPPILKEFKIPLQGVFDPDAGFRYVDNAQAFYGRSAPALTSDLPLRDGSEHPPVRESLIDTGGMSNGDDPAEYADLETIKPAPASSNAARSDYRRTQDWTFPATTPASAGLYLPTSEQLTIGPVHANPQRASSASLIDLDASLDVLPPETFNSGHVPVNPNRASAVSLIDLDASLDVLPPQQLNMGYLSVNPNRASTLSLIDLDVSLPSMTRPGTAASDGTSTDSESGSTPSFNLDSYPGLREPSLYVPEGLGWMSVQDFEERSPSATSPLGKAKSAVETRLVSISDAGGSYALPVRLPMAPSIPSEKTMGGAASQAEVKEDLLRMISSLEEHLRVCNTAVRNLPVHRTGHDPGKATL